MNPKTMVKTRRKSAADKATRPNLAAFDRRWRLKRGIELIGGLDEAGRGALAGPVVAACVVLAPGTRLDGLDDSKVLLPQVREKLAPRIMDRAAAWAVGWASAAEIDQINVLRATLRAAGRAMPRLATRPEFLLTDFLKPCWPDCAPPCEYEPLVDGDARSQAIAAASILAKVARDHIMAALDEEYPGYNFASNKGYATPDHWRALDAHGASTVHRLTYQGVVPEPFFDLVERPPLRRCLSHPNLRICSRAPIDWVRIIKARPGKLRGADFLPEPEWLL